MEFLMIKKLQKSYAKLKVLKDISFSAKEGEFVSILGASGCGKTTVLRIIAGLEKSDGGSIIIDGEDVSDMLSAQRNVGMVFQNYSLFPNMTVYQNITFALRYKRGWKDLNYPLVDEVIQKCELQDFLDRLPCQLSGGQQQRTAIARSLVMSPRILMFDEPFSALDVSIRQKLRKLIKKFQSDFHITMIYVTHDQEEAFTLSDKIVIIHEGMVQQIGKPDEIFRSPKNTYVADFIQKQLEERYADLCKIVRSTK